MQEEETYKKWLGAKNHSAAFKRLFCRDIALDFLKDVSATLPVSIPLYLFLDAQDIRQSSEFYSLLSPEALYPFSPILKNGAFKLPNLQKMQTQQSVCLPLLQNLRQVGAEICQSFLETMQKPYRLIPESELTESWEGVDELYVVSSGVSRLGMRKLQGFEAAGGTIIYS